MGFTFLTLFFIARDTFRNATRNLANKVSGKKIASAFFRFFSHFLPIKGCFLASFLETHSSKRDEGGGGMQHNKCKKWQHFWQKVW